MTLNISQQKFNKKILLFFHDRDSNKKNFRTLLLRMIIAFDLFFWCVINLKFQKIFNCLNVSMRFFSFSIIKNMLMKRIEKIQHFLLKIFFDDVKIFLIMNCWFSFNRQKFFEMNAYFINLDWIYHEMLIEFEHVVDFHTNAHLIEIVWRVLKRHNLKRRILISISNNVKNNDIMHIELIQFVRNAIRENDFLKNVFNLMNFEKIFCLVHVLQLTLQQLLKKIRVISNNVELKTFWNDHKNKKKFVIFQTSNVFHILTKINWNLFMFIYLFFFLNIFEEFCIHLTIEMYLIYC